MPIANALQVEGGPMSR